MSIFEPHPFALLLPSLTDAEYKALKADIKAHGILYPVILDEDDRILDGVHRVRIAKELGMEPPVARHTGLTDERKLHLAVGLNMRRRHLDADRRRELVRNLHKTEGLSLRKISSITGWSKSTIDRDLKTSPFEALLASAQTASSDLIAALPAEVRKGLSPVFDALTEVFRFGDEQWKRGNWPPPATEHFAVTLAVRDITNVLREIADLLRTGSKEEHNRLQESFSEKRQEREETWRTWNELSEAEQEEKARDLQDRGLLWQPPVPDGTPDRLAR